MDLLAIDPDTTDTREAMARWMTAVAAHTGDLHREAEAIVVLAEGSDPDGAAARLAVEVMEYLQAARNAASMFLAVTRP